MKRQEVKAIMKAEVKALAAEIRLGKSGRKPANLNESNRQALSYLDENRAAFRHLHIVYCLMKGTAYESIEKPSEKNPPNAYVLDKLRKKYEGMISEEVAA